MVYRVDGSETLGPPVATDLGPMVTDLPNPVLAVGPDSRVWVAYTIDWQQQAPPETDALDLFVTTT